MVGSSLSMLIEAFLCSIIFTCLIIVFSLFGGFSALSNHLIDIAFQNAGRQENERIIVHFLQCPAAVCFPKSIAEKSAKVNYSPWQTGII
jgi:hypothetical protein